MGVPSDIGLPNFVSEALALLDSELDSLVHDAATGSSAERQFVEYHVRTIRRQASNFEGGKPAASEPAAPNFQREMTGAVLARTRRMRRLLDERVLPWCQQIDVVGNSWLQGLTRLLAAIYALEFPLEAQHPDLADHGPSPG